MEQTAALEEYYKKLKIWKQEEAVVKQQIAGMIPDSLFLKICMLPTAEFMWEVLGANFQNKSHMVLIDLC
ncbi:hypothetical protein CVT25_001000 [Psilocybe cyanescens]|uniref:Uncharacterized protein n=1 Tax=Psilocybe cyanescens TaxID=93625 RepID=A0A409XS31_PSICY|nr:hypothetical protein CVT25_001000 [Psilocybe cyanescens]